MDFDLCRLGTDARETPLRLEALLHELYNRFDYTIIHSLPLQADM